MCIVKMLQGTEMLLHQKDPKGFTVQTSRNEFKTSIKNEDEQLIYSKKSKKSKKFNRKIRSGQ